MRVTRVNPENVTRRERPTLRPHEETMRLTRSVVGDLDVMTGGCRWPSGEGREIMFCGAERVLGRPYCDEHMRVAYPTWGK